MSVKELATRFDKLQLKERRLVLLASLLGLALLAYSLGIDPAQHRAATNAAQAAQQRNELNTLQTQLTELRRQSADPDAGLRAQVEDTRSRIAGVEQELHAFDHLLVPPREMPQLLRALLAKNRGLELVRLKTLPVAPLLATETAPSSDPTHNAAAHPQQAQPATRGSPAEPPPGGIYRHAVEITVAGSYFDLLRYAEELQRISPRPLWSEMTLKVVEYPRSELTFTLYTLSLDLPWLAV